MCHDVDESLNIGWSCGGGGRSRVGGIGRQDGGVATAEGDGFSTGELVPVVGLWWDEAWGGGWGFHGRCVRPVGKEEV